MALLEDKKDVKKTLKSFFHPNFYRLHLLYFIVTILVTSGILYGSGTAAYHISYVNALYLCTSAMCNTGLTSINISSLNGYQQSVLFTLMILGDLTTVTISVVYVRRYFFSKRMSELVKESRSARHIAEDIEEQPEGSDSSEQSGPGQTSSAKAYSNSARSEQDRASTKPRQKHREPLLDAHHSGYGSFPTPWPSGSLRKTLDWQSDHPPSQEHHYLSFKPQLDHKVSTTWPNETRVLKSPGTDHLAQRPST